MRRRPNTILEEVHGNPQLVFNSPNAAKVLRCLSVQRHGLSIAGGNDKLIDRSRNDRLGLK